MAGCRILQAIRVATWLKANSASWTPLTDSKTASAWVGFYGANTICELVTVDSTDQVSEPSANSSGLQATFELCRKLGMRLSRQRRMVLDLLWTEASHLSARDIFEKLNNQGRRIGHTSVYQNLEALQSAGVIECLDRASGRLYGYRRDPHSHLICIENGTIEDLDVELPDQLLREIERRTGYTIETYTLQLSGRPKASDRE